MLAMAMAGMILRTRSMFKKERCHYAGIRETLIFEKVVEMPTHMPIMLHTGKDRAMQGCNPSSPGPCGESWLISKLPAGPGRQASELNLPVLIHLACQLLNQLHTGCCKKSILQREKGY